MKKILISLLIMALVSPVSAQIVSSQSERVIVTKKQKEKKKRTVKFMVKGGIGADLEENSSFGYDASFGVALPVGKKGLLWMPEVGAMSRGSIAPLWGGDEKMKHTIQLSPINFGWKFPLNKNNNVSLLPFVGLFGGYSINLDDRDWDYNTYEVKRQTHYGGDWADRRVGTDKSIRGDFELGANIGLSVLIKGKYLLGIHSRIGFVPRTCEVTNQYEYVNYTNGVLNTAYDSDSDEKKYSIKKLMFSFGILF